jgi:transposase
MPTVLRDTESLDHNEAAEISIDRRPPAENVTIQDARRAMDHAVMAIFELAFSLESLSDAISRFKAETYRQLREWQHPGVLTDDLS